MVVNIFTRGGLCPSAVAARRLCCLKQLRAYFFSGATFFLGAAFFLGATFFLGAAFLAAGNGERGGRVCEWVGPGLRCDRRQVLAST